VCRAQSAGSVIKGIGSRPQGPEFCFRDKSVKTRVMRQWCRCCQYTVLALSGCDASVVGMCMSMLSGRGVILAGCVCWCHWDGVLVSSGCGQCRWDGVSVSSGCGVSVIGIWCRSHWDAVLASSGGGVGIGIVRRQGASS